MGYGAKAEPCFFMAKEPPIAVGIESVSFGIQVGYCALVDKLCCRIYHIEGKNADKETVVTFMAFLSKVYRVNHMCTETESPAADRLIQRVLPHGWKREIVKKEDVVLPDTFSTVRVSF